MSYVASVKLAVSKLRCSVGHAMLRELMSSLLFKGHAVAQLADTALQVGRSRVPFPMVLLSFSIDIILPALLWPSL